MRVSATATRSSLTVEIRGEPVAKGRPRASIRKTKAGDPKVHMRTPDKTRAYEDAIAAAVRRELAMASIREAHAHPVRMTLRATYAYRKTPAPGWSTQAWREATGGWMSIPKPTLPDLDNLAKAALDGIQAGGWLKNDGQVYQLSARKEWGPCDAVHVELEIDPPPD